MRFIGRLSAARNRLFGSAANGSVLLRGTIGSFGVKALSNGLLFGAQLLFAKHIGVDGFGVYVLSLAWMNILLLLGRQGFDLATIRYVAAYQADRRWGHLSGFLRASTATVFASSALVSMGLVLYCFLARERLGSEMQTSLLIVGGIVPLFALLQIKAATLRGLGKVVLGDIPHAIVHPVLLIVLPVIAVAFLDVSPSSGGALGAYLVSIAASLAVVWFMVRRQLPTEAANARPEYRWRDWLLTAPAMTLIAGFGIVLSQIGAIMLGALSTTADAGIYGATARVALSLQLIVFSLISALSPMVARLHAANDLSGLQRAIASSGRLVFLLCLLCAAVLLLSGKWILGWFGPEFISGYTAMAILLIGQLVWAANAPAGVILNMSGHHNASAVFLGGAIVLNIALSFLLIPSMGTVGAAIANAATIVVWNIMTAVAVFRWLGIRSWARLFVKQHRAVTV